MSSLGSHLKATRRFRAKEMALTRLTCSISLNLLARHLSKAKQTARLSTR